MPGRRESLLKIHMSSPSLGSGEVMTTNPSGTVAPFYFENGKIPKDVLREEAVLVKKRRRAGLVPDDVSSEQVDNGEDLRATDLDDGNPPPDNIGEYGDGQVELTPTIERAVGGNESAGDLPTEASSQRSADDDILRAAPIGLSLSSGGLRSCTFTLGFVQALHHSGFLRCCDYVSSVSGGGFVAGHLTSLADALRHPGFDPMGNPQAVETGKPQVFHDGAGTETDVLGVQRTGQILPHFSFSTVGEYLFGSPNDLLPLGFRYLCSTIPLLLCTIAPIGFLMTLAALLWRSLDYEAVRTILSLLGIDVLADQMNWGQETLIAYVPACLMLVILLIYSLVLGLLALTDSLIHWHIPFLKSMARWGGRLLAFTFLIWIMGSVAYLSNGWSDSFGADVGVQLQTLSSNYAAYLSVLMTLPLFFTRRLAESAKASAPTWQRIFSRMVVSGVLTCTPLLLFYWMVSENISEFVDHRGPELLRHDILDWPQFTILDDDLELPSVGNEENLNCVAAMFPAKADSNLMPEEAILPGVVDPAMRFERLRVWNWIFRLSTLRPMLCFATGNFAAGNSNSRTPSTVIGDYLTKEIQQNEAREVCVGRWNVRLSSENLTERLLDRLASRYPQLMQEPIDVEASARLHNIVSERANGDAPNSELPSLPRETVVDEFLNAARRHPRYPLDEREMSVLRKYLLAVCPGRNADGLATDQWSLKQLVNRGALNDHDPAGFNRLLLETLYPEIIRKRMMVSTFITVGPDQEARCYWLFLWWLLFMLGLCLNVNLHSPLYEYYRERLVNSFLWPSVAVAAVKGVEPRSRDSSRKSGWTGRLTPQLSQVQPWLAGAPFPIFVATMSLFKRIDWMRAGAREADSKETLRRDGALADDTPPMTFTPLHCGSYVLGYRKSADYCRGELSLEDAVALSGAPITPMVTKSLPMRVMLGMLNARLGMWLPLPFRQSALAGFPFVNILNAFAVNFDAAPEVGEHPVVTKPPHRAFGEASIRRCLFVALCVGLAVGGYCLLINLMGLWSKERATIPAIDWFPRFSVSDIVADYTSWQLAWPIVGLMMAVLLGWFVAKYLLRVLAGPVDFRPVVDGCFHDAFGIEELLLRHCRTIVVVDGGRNNDEWQMTALAESLRMMEERHGILVDEAPETEQLEPHKELLLNQSPKDLRIQKSHFVKLRLKYPPPLTDKEADTLEVLRQSTHVDVYYCQMSLTGDEPLDILNYARRTRTFPNEPNSNQFFTMDQSETFRRLGYHIGKTLCDSQGLAGNFPSTSAAPRITPSAKPVPVAVFD